jgi:hypothetical protein
VSLAGLEREKRPSSPNQCCLQLMVKGTTRSPIQGLGGLDILVSNAGRQQTTHAAPNVGERLDFGCR